MSARIILTDLDGEKFIQNVKKTANGRKAMRVLAMLLGRSARTGKTMIIGLSGRYDREDNANDYPTYLVRADCVRSVRLLEDDPEDEVDGAAASMGGDDEGDPTPNMDDPDWWKK